ncbi:hypothetical protein WJX81_002794 [Elliptochloris bilobata]|uniref:Oleosin n=1 Tax=Elliptochloris bilobata TaxID=381761 RepID=A0AAW1RCM5_9CHLO
MSAPLGHFNLPMKTRGGQAHTEGLHQARRTLRAPLRATGRSARSAWGDRDDSPVAREARRVAQQAYAEAEREVVFAKRQLARAEEEARAQQGRLSKFVERRGWGAVAAPALGAVMLASLFGPLIWGLLFTSVVAFGGVAFIGLLPAIIMGSLAFGAAAVGLGLFATATAVVLPSVFALVAVGGGLALGSFLIRTVTAPRGAAASTSRSARGGGGAATGAAADMGARRAPEEAEEEDLAAAAARELRRFDRELAERERKRQVEEGTRWTP